VELPNFAIIVPVQRGKQLPMHKLTVRLLEQLKSEDVEVQCMVNKNFMAQTDGLNVPCSENIAEFDPALGVRTTLPNLQQINLQSIAKVCNTTGQSVELMIQEIVA